MSGGATTTGPDATHPRAICQTWRGAVWGGGGGMSPWGRGWREEGGIGGTARGEVPRGGGGA